MKRFRPALRLASLAVALAALLAPAHAGASLALAGAGACGTGAPDSTSALSHVTLTPAVAGARSREALETSLSAAESEFDLFAGVPPSLLGPDNSGRFEPFAGVRLLAPDSVSVPSLALARSLGGSKTHIGVFDFLGSTLVGVRSGESYELHWVSDRFGLGITSGSADWLSEDPEGDVDSPNLYAYVGWRPNEFTDPMGTCMGLDDIPCSEYGKEFGNQFLFSNLGATAKRSGRFALFEAKGAALAVPHLLKGVAQVALHPVSTIQALGTAAGETIADPTGTAKRAGNALLNADPDRAGEFVGETLGLAGLGAAAKTVEGMAAIGRAQQLFGGIAKRGQFLEDVFESTKLRQGVQTFNTKAGRVGIDLGTFEGGEAFLNEVKFAKNVNANNLTSFGLHEGGVSKNLPRNLNRAIRGAGEADLPEVVSALQQGTFNVRIVGGPGTTFDRLGILESFAEKGIGKVTFETVRRREILRYILLGK